MLFADDPIPIHIACNHPDTGRFNGRFGLMDVGDDCQFRLETYQLETGEFAGPACRIYTRRDGTKRIGVGPHAFTIYGHATWVGNWCWDRVTMPGSEVLRLLNLPLIRNWFSCVEAEMRLFNLWKAGADFDENCLRILLKP